MPKVTELPFLQNPLNSEASLVIVMDDQVQLVGINTLATYFATDPLTPPSFSVQPSITSDGTPQVGEALTGDDGEVQNGVISARQWLQAGEPIPTAASGTFTPGPTQFGATLAYRVTATGNGGTVQATSAPITIAPMLLQQAFAAGDSGFWFRPTNPATLRTAAAATPVAGQDVATVLDQSGGGHHGTLATPAKYQLAGNNRGVLLFDGTQHIDVPASLTFDRRAMTLFVVINSAPSSVTEGLFNTPPGSTTTLGLHSGVSATANGGALTSFPVFSPVSGVFQPARATRVLAVVYSGTERRVFDGRQEVTGAAASAAAATAGAYLMRWNTGIATKASGLLHEYAVIRRAMTAAEVRAIVDELAMIHGAYDRQSLAAGVGTGDSLSAGVFTDPAGRTNLEWAQHYLQWMVERFPRGKRPKVSNFAQGGAHIRTIRDTQIPALNTELQRFAAAGYSQLFAILAGGTNDANGPTTGYPNAATGAALIQAYTDLFNGITVPGVVKFAKTIPPRGASSGPQWAPAINELNAWLQSGSSPFGANIIDDRADPRIADPKNRTYYIDDELHYTGGPGGGHDALGEIAYGRLIAAGITGA